MATSVTTRTFSFGDGLTYATQDVRLALSCILSGLGGGSGNTLGIGSGVKAAAGSPMKVINSSGLSVTVNTGQCAIQGSAALNSGTYFVTLDAAATLTCTAADTVNSRIDAVCVSVTDLGTSSSTSVVQIVTGTPASSPSAPALPANSIPLCYITVPANATTLTSGNLADQRPSLAAAGGIKNVLNSSFYPTVGAGSEYIHDSGAARMKWFNGTAVVAPKTAAFAPASNGPNTVSATGTVETVSSVSVTVDGSTTVKVTFTFDSVTNAGTSAGNACTVGLVRGSTGLKSITKICWGPDSPLDGGTIVVNDINPAAGTYTYGATIVNQGAGTYAVHNGIIYVEAISG